MNAIPRNEMERGFAAKRLVYGLAYGFSALAAVTYGLITLGALVRANAAGLACPDWPLCFDELIPQFDVKVAFEWGHRLLAGMVSTGLFLLTVLACRRPELLGYLKWRLVIVWGLLAAQVVFGGLTVLHRLAPWTVSGHLVLGNSFCFTLAWIASDLFEHARGPVARPPLPKGVRGLAVGIAFSLGLQLVLGGLVAGSFAGLACTDFPTCDGSRFIPSLSGAIGLHVMHRLNALVLFLVFAVLAGSTLDQGRVGHFARLGFGLVILQIALGVTDVLLRIPVEITALHTATAAAIVLSTALLMREVILTRVAEAQARVKTAARMVEA